jgi:hypothetical protein
VRGHAHVLVVEAGPAAEPLGELPEHVAPDLDQLEVRHLLARLLDVAEVGQEQALLARDDARPVRPGEAGEPADVQQVRDDERVQLALVE